MGNDGGSIPKRSELVKEAARDRTTAELKESRLEQQEYYWTTDPISQKSLVQPVVSDSSGKLYNKDTILEYLVEGSRKEDADAVTQGTIKSLKDVVEVKFELNDEAASKVDGTSATWKCPITGDKLGPGSKAVYLVPCGHAFSGNAIKEVSGEKCMTCDTEYASNDIIPILPISETDIARLSLRMNTLREKGLTHSLKKASGSGKKRKKDEVVDASTEPPGVSNGTSVQNGTPRTSTPVNGNSNGDDRGGINNASTASLTAKVVQEQERAKKRKMENENVRSLFSSKDPSVNASKSADFMTRGFSIPKNAKR